MYEVWFIWRDDWGNLSFVKRAGFQKKLSTAIRLAKQYGHNSYVKKYGTTKPLFINNPELEVLHNATTN